MIDISEWPTETELIAGANRLLKDSVSLSSLGTSRHNQESIDYARIADFLKYLAGRMK
jgi:hypothetical protein